MMKSIVCFFENEFACESWCEFTSGKFGVQSDIDH